MSIATVDFLHGIKSGSNFLSQFTSQELSPGIAAMIGHAAGMPFPQYAGVVNRKPEKRFATSQVKTALDMCGVLLTDLSANNCDLFFKVGADAGSRQAPTDSVHKRFRAAKAMMELQSLSVGHTTEAQAVCRIICGYDGVNQPLVYSGTEQLEGTPTSAEHFYLGECHLNSAQIEGVQDLSIDFGREVLQLGSEGEILDSANIELSQSPTILVTAINSDLWGTIGPDGVAVTGGSFYLRKNAVVNRVADATAQHIKFAITAGMAYIDTTYGDGRTHNLTRLIIRPVSASATVTPITVNTAIAMTT